MPLICSSVGLLTEWTGSEPPRATSSEPPQSESEAVEGGRARGASGPDRRPARRLATASVRRPLSGEPGQAVADAAAIWRDLLAGRWSLVGHFDADARRFVLARANEGAKRGRVSGLSARQNQACERAAAGYGNKAIGHHLGVSASTVSVLLSRAAAKVGARSRVALIEIWRARGG